MKRLKLFTVLILLLTLYSLSLAGQWLNPKDLIGDPNLVQLQQGRKELTLEEKEDIKKYGFTGLEIMTYMDINRDHGQDYDVIGRITSMNSFGIITVSDELLRYKYCPRDYKARLTLDGVKPGDKEYMRIGYNLSPSRSKGNVFQSNGYLKSKELYKENVSWGKMAALRKVRRGTTPNREDKGWGTDTTRDDRGAKEPWEENHKILGEDTLRGMDCFVMESKMWFVKNYYLSKRVTWIEKKNFIDIHEEQFDRKGRLFKIMDKEWVQIKPWNYWVINTWYTVDLSIRSKTLEQNYEWIFDQGLTEKDFSKKVMMNDNPWREPKNPLPLIEKVSDFPPDPHARWEFWEKLGIKPEVYK